MAKPVSRLILTGFMGAGKSTVGPLLARELGWKFLDLDQVIEARSESTVAEIFREHGEFEFRRRELAALREVIREQDIVLALGGGAIENEAARLLLADSPGNCLVFLHGEWKDLMARCSAEGKTRPLLADLAALEARHTRRLPHYRAAHITVTTTGLTPQDVAMQVLVRVSQEWQIEVRRDE
jgi:shikimate kinase